MKKIIFCFFLISGVVVASDFSIESIFPSEELLRSDTPEIPMQIEDLPFGFKIVVHDNDDISNDIDEQNKTEKKRIHHFNHQKMPPKHEQKCSCPPPPPPCRHLAENTDCFQLGHRISCDDDVSFNKRCGIEKRTDSMVKLMKNHHKGEEILGILHKQTQLLKRIMISLEKLLEERTNYHKKHYEFPFVDDN